MATIFRTSTFTPRRSSERGAVVVDLIGRRRWLTEFLVAKSREGWLFFCNSSGIDPPFRLHV